MTRPRRRRRLICAVTVGAFAVSAWGCTPHAADGSAPASPIATRTGAPLVAPTTDTSVPAPVGLSPGGSVAPSSSRKPAATPAATDAVPRIVSVAITPVDLNQPPCITTAVRPRVTARVTDSDDAPGTLRVLANYSLSDTYRGEVRMSYDPGVQAFVYQLPPVDTRALRGNAGHLSVTILVTDHAGIGPRPSDSAIASVNSCIPVGNG